MEKHYSLIVVRHIKKNQIVMKTKCYYNLKGYTVQTTSFVYLFSTILVNFDNALVK